MQWLESKNCSKIFADVPVTIGLFHLFSFLFRNSLYGFASTRNSLELCQEKDRESLLQVNNADTLSSLQLYRVDTNVSPCLLTGNGHVDTRLLTGNGHVDGRFQSRYTCTQHGTVKYFTEQGTQTVKSFNRLVSRDKVVILHINRTGL